MGLSIYLAMTAWEYYNCDAPPEFPAWMACHFSSSGSGLSNIPAHFPTGGILMLNDQIPPANHSPNQVAQQLMQAVEAFSPRGVILDFQRPFHSQCQDIARKIAAMLPCPVAITDTYRQDWSGPLFLPPIPPGKNIETYLQKWQGREIWLEITKTAERLIVDKNGCTRQPMNQLPGMPVFQDDRLFCHYSTDISQNQAVFSLWRTDEDLAQMLACAKALGVTAAVGLYQEFC